MEQPESNPRSCKNNCGYYGSQAYEGMCSQCYKDHLKEKYDTGSSPCNNYYSPSMNHQTSSTSSFTSQQPQPQEDEQAMDDSAHILGSMDEDNDSSMITVMKSGSEKSTAVTNVSENETNDESLNSDVMQRIVSTPSLPISITKNIDIPKNSTTSLSELDNSVSGAESISLSASSVDRKKKRCLTCNKKLTLTDYPCRCGGHYCSLHRYANEHQCTFDYKEHGQNEIRRNMPVVQGDKITKI
ncbi:unnamed protein product [Didymodactylos carnosus]|uniref:Uncharacterized protein n=1 Tax=Didymodactylos carnosus TaxID=1234261 RepID=A0A813SS35_9BILA|nr:unnamed protein product [Didymodactylos carnosus]CAF0804617.1 unnamed protein product [Didymodactylos carnosus]CAF3559746.1 unnamed protein product [Didymodactylos carnosus]CAF3589940.1 unnamed protein product [Didymodactylos carnosus]